MSAIAQYPTVFRDSELIAAACKELGLTCQVLDPQHVRIPYNSAVGLYFSIDFNRQPDGNYQAVMDEDYYRDWLPRLTQEYKIAERMRAAQKAGLVFTGRKVLQTEKGPRVQLAFVKR